MVTRGQFLERPTVIPSGGYFLEALSHRGTRRPGLLLVPSHPSRGASMDAPVCAELAFAGSQRGHPTLRFNYRGVGASQGPLSDFEACLEDAVQALAALRENVGHDELAVIGHDFGAEVVLELARRGAVVSSVVLISPLTSAYDFSSLAELAVPGLIVVGQQDATVDRLTLAKLCQSRGDELVAIPEADRSFRVGLTEVGREVMRFLGGEPPAID